MGFGFSKARDWPSKLEIEKKIELSFSSPKIPATIIWESANGNPNRIGFFTVDCSGKSNRDYPFLAEVIVYWLKSVLVLVYEEFVGNSALILLRHENNGARVVVLFRPALVQPHTRSETSLFEKFVHAMEQAAASKDDDVHANIFNELAVNDRDVFVNDERLDLLFRVMVHPYRDMERNINVKSDVLISAIKESVELFARAGNFDGNNGGATVRRANGENHQHHGGIRIHARQVQLATYEFDKDLFMRVSCMLWPPYNDRPMLL